jgi:hypothetical protein
VQNGQFPHPRSVNPDVPAGLEAICLKAMSRNPKDRYPTAQTLVADLNAWMADEPVAAWTEPLSIRTRRWVRGHQVVVGIAATALLILTMVSPVMTLQQSRIAATERQQSATEKENAREQAQLRTDAENAREVSEEQKAVAQEQQRIAEAAREKADASRKQTEATLARSNYFLAQARWDNNRVADARELLQKVPQQHRNIEWYLARREFEGSDVALYGHTGSVFSVSFSPDGTRIASGSQNPTIRLWDAATGEGLHTLKGHTVSVTSVRFSPDGMRLVSRDHTGQKLIWDLKARAVLPDGNVEEFSAGNDSSRTPDGRWLAIPSADDVLLVDLAYEKTPLERQRRKLLARPKPRRHSKQFQTAQSEKQ